MSEDTNNQKVVVVGAGPVGALAALYAAERGDNVEVYELRAGRSAIHYKQIEELYCSHSLCAV